MLYILDLSVLLFIYFFLYFFGAVLGLIINGSVFYKKSVSFLPPSH